MSDDDGHSPPGPGTGETVSAGESAFDHLVRADQRLVRTVDSLDDDAYAAPSGLPGWSRAHVVAHLALHAEALAGVVDGLARDERVPMYPSPEARDRDIEALAAEPAADVRARLLGGVALLTDAVTELPVDRWAGVVERTPGGRHFPAHQLVARRLVEVEVHHVDLAAGYTPAHWPRPFAVMLVETMRARAWPSPFRVLARDVARTWDFGADASGRRGPTVSGDSHAIAWWLTGRGDGSDLTADRGRLPEVEKW